eukprot:CAMPEP_0175788606 /NCGR_PEP_ID=MMETSP0097-20121207/80971_1 /TAXON_ID=311494 /ORGANISM="Alexandrium monilatum, Strain CCMP3105" /LENGTH=63 /DNA_ID=CAMNT_0017099635 /DNA_START=9 /DNA_END=197 /DNA_ORIENTATION=+
MLSTRVRGLAATLLVSSAVCACAASQGQCEDARRQEPTQTGRSGSLSLLQLRSNTKATAHEAG